MVIEPIRVQGLAALNRGLRKLDKDAPKGLRLAGNAAAELIVDTARPRIPRRSGRAARTVKARSTRTAARVSAGGSRVPYFPWLDFGGEGRVAGRPSKRPFKKEGRYLWAALAERRDDVTRVLERELLKVVESAGLEAD